MTPEQREELKTAAMNATQGKWKSDETRVYLPSVNGGFSLLGSPNAEANATHIALANPAAILSLIAQVEALTVPQINRDDVLEEAAKVCDIWSDPYDNASNAAMAIRELKTTIPAIPGTKEGA